MIILGKCTYVNNLIHPNTGPFPFYMTALEPMFPRDGGGPGCELFSGLGPAVHGNSCLPLTAPVWGALSNPIMACFLFPGL